MPFCGKCGNKVEDNAKFCSRCGTKVIASDRARQSFAGAYQTGAVNNPSGAPYQPQVQQRPAVDPGMTVRYRCPNGDVFDGFASQTSCPACGAALQKGGYIQVYRMGNMMGMAVGMGVYVDDIPFGHVGNKQSVCISVPYGRHKLHMTHTSTRACNDPVYMITPQNPHVYCKAHFSAGGFRITIEDATPESMPKK